MRLIINIHEALGLHHVSIATRINKADSNQKCVAWFPTRAEADELASKLCKAFETSGVDCLVQG